MSQETINEAICEVFENSLSAAKETLKAIEAMGLSLTTIEIELQDLKRRVGEIERWAGWDV